MRLDRNSTTGSGAGEPQRRGQDGRSPRRPPPATLSGLGPDRASSVTGSTRPSSALGPPRAQAAETAVDGLGHLQTPADHRVDGADGGAVDGDLALDRLQIGLRGDAAEERRSAPRRRPAPPAAGRCEVKNDVSRTNGFAERTPTACDGRRDVGGQTGRRRVDRRRLAVHVDGHRLAVSRDAPARSSAAVACSGVIPPTSTPAIVVFRSISPAGAEQVDQVDHAPAPAGRHRQRSRPASHRGLDRAAARSTAAGADVGQRRSPASLRVGSIDRVIRLGDAALAPVS